MRPRRACALAAAVLVPTLSAIACGAGDERGPYDRVADRAIPDIERRIGLKFKRRPTIEAQSKEQVRAYLQEQLRDTAVQREFAGQERAYKRFGLIPAEMDLERLYLDLLSEQVVGFYDPKRKTLHVVSGREDDPLARVTVAHELVHALQDQYYDLDSLKHFTGDNDRQTAISAVVEGQATYEHTMIAVGGESNFASRFPGGWEMIRNQIRDQYGAMPRFAEAPLLVQEVTIFPYLSGAEFVKRVHEREPRRNPMEAVPLSTEQVMHPDAFFGTRDEPTRVTLPAPTSARDAFQNNLGEFETRVFLYQHTDDQAGAIRAAAGWDGDRYMVLETPRGEGIAWLTVWDSPVDAGEFLAMIERTVRARYGDIRSTGTPGGARTYTAASRTVYIDPTEVQGRPVVLYVDVPAGAPTRVLDPGRVRLSP